jgi:serine/threonine protein kinase
VEPVSTGGPRGVWRAVDEAAGHEVAVKALGARAAWSMTDRARLRIAFGTVSALSDPGVARVHEYGEMGLPGGLALPYLVRELVPGQSLEERLGAGPAPLDEALSVVARVADALAVAHRAGVVHGNLVPGNVIVGPAAVKVTDFGLWALRDHLASAHRQDTSRQSVLSYAAPERLSGEPPSPAADMYSLGVLFVACLSGIAPGGTAGSPPVMDPDDSVAPSLASLWAACLGANPRERPSAAHAAFMSRQILAAWPPAPGQHDDVPTPAGHAAEPGAAAPDLPAAAAVGAQEPDGAARPGDAAGRAAVPAPVGGPARPGRRRHSTQPGAPGRGGRPRSDRPGSLPRDLSRALRGRAGLVTLGVVAGITAAVVMLTQFLASPSAQTTGASATPSARAQISQHAPAGPSASRPAPSAEVSSSVLASTAPPPLQVLNEIRATIRHGVADGQIRQDVGVDLDNLIQPIQAGLAAGNTAQVPVLVAGLRAKLATRLSEGAIAQAADQQLNSELTTLLRASAGRGG